MTLCADRTRLLQRAGRERAERLLPEPFKLWYSDHSTGCQMTIVAKGGNDWLTVWQGSIWYSDRYEFNDRQKIGGLQPDFVFARDVIEKYFADVASEVEQATKARAEREAAQKAAAEEKKRTDLEGIQRQIRGAA